MAKGTMELPPHTAVKVMPPERPHLLVEDPRWRATINDLERIILRTCAMTLRYGQLETRQRPLPAIVLSNNHHVKRLNARFRGRNKPTNVLTFEPLTPFDSGDIILAFGVVQHEATEAGRSLRAHFTHLLIHGLLHLAGHDHHQAGEARRMENRETRILRSLGFADPWKQGGKRRT